MLWHHFSYNIDSFFIYFIVAFLVHLYFRTVKNCDTVYTNVTSDNCKSKCTKQTKAELIPYFSILITKISGVHVLVLPANQHTHSFWLLENGYSIRSKNKTIVVKKNAQLKSQISSLLPVFLFMIFTSFLSLFSPPIADATLCLVPRSSFQPYRAPGVSVRVCVSVCKRVCLSVC